MGPETEGYGLFRKDGKQVAGIGPATDPARGTSWATYFAVDDADDAANRVLAGGGQVVLAPMDVMDLGRLAVCTDPTGAFFSVWQAGKHTGAELVNEPGSLNWNELLTTDLDAVRSFYPSVFGLTTREVPMGEAMTYTLMEVGGRAVAGAFPLEPGTEGSSPFWSVYFAVEDTDASHAKAIELGASAVAPPQDSPAGRFTMLTDPQGGVFSVITINPDFNP
jgi:predicted enzyme related to lactoylglutathione lyase